MIMKLIAILKHISVHKKHRVSLDDVVYILKHLAGQHNQKSHGRGGGGIVATSDEWLAGNDKYTKEMLRHSKWAYKNKAGYEVMADRAIDNILSEYTEPRLRVSENNLGIIVDSGEIRNAFSTGSSTADRSSDFSTSSYKDNRANFEERVWGPDAHPVYGYLSNGKDTTDIKSYGSIVFHFDDALKDKSTFVVGDSMNANAKGRTGFIPRISPSPVNNPSRRSVEVWAEGDNTAYDLAESSSKLNGYVELQIWGGPINLADSVSKISGVKRGSLTEAQETKLQDMEIEISYAN